VLPNRSRQKPCYQKCGFSVERELLIERTRAGLLAARARGRKGGRPRKMDKTSLQMAIQAMSDPSSCAKDVAKKLNITTATLYSYVNGDGTLKVSGQKLLNHHR